MMTPTLNAFLAFRCFKRRRRERLAGKEGDSVTPYITQRKKKAFSWTCTTMNSGCIILRTRHLLRNAVKDNYIQLYYI